jgi:uncharacterized protein YjbI with pentapeptide repeats
MAIPHHLEVINQGVAEWNKWRIDNPAEEPDLAEEANLRETDLRWADLTCANLSNAFLNRADLRRANLTQTIFRQANLSEANLSETYLSGADLSKADLKKAFFIRSDLANVNLSNSDCQRADFRWAYLIKARFNGANLNGANLIEANLTKAELKRSNLSEAFVAWSCFGDNDLSQTQGLNEVKHFGPSTIGIDTIYRSKGNIPEEFLRGAGVPEHFISYTRYLNEKAFAHCSCFISFSGNDRNFVEKIGEDLQREGIRCWYAPEEMKMGDAIRQQVDQLIRIQDKLLVVLSKFSVESPWIQKEVAAALAEERNRRRTVLVSLCLDNGCMDSEKDWLANLQKSRQIYDFSTWENWEAYYTQFNYLLGDLKTS